MQAKNDSVEPIKIPVLLNESCKEMIDRGFAQALYVNDGKGLPEYVVQVVEPFVLNKTTVAQIGYFYAQYRGSKSALLPPTRLNAESLARLKRRYKKYTGQELMPNGSVLGPHYNAPTISVPYVRVRAAVERTKNNSNDPRVNRLYDPRSAYKDQKWKTPLRYVFTVEESFIFRSEHQITGKVMFYKVREGQSFAFVLNQEYYFENSTLKQTEVGRICRLDLNADEIRTFIAESRLKELKIRQKEKEENKEARRSTARSLNRGRKIGQVTRAGTRFIARFTSVATHTRAKTNAGV